ncbi:hypothetical protein GCM10027403_12980 [Arthrobacter tecti]
MTVQYRDLEQMVEELTVLSRRLSGTSGPKIAASRGKGEKHAYTVTRRALDRLGLATLEDYRPHQRHHLEHLRDTCHRVANTPGADRADLSTAAVGLVSADILIAGLDDIVDEPAHHIALEAAR